MTPSTAPTATVNTCCLSATGIGFLGHPVPAAGVRSSSRSTHRNIARTWAGFPRSTCARPDRGGCRLYPEGGGVHATKQMPLVAACRFPAASPCTPAPLPIYPGLTLTRRHRQFTHVHPPGLPLTHSPRMDQGPLRLSPELRTPPLPATHVRGGDRATNTHPGYVIDNTADLHSTRHLHMRPRVAPPARCLPAGRLNPRQVRLSVAGQALSRINTQLHRHSAKNLG